MAILAVAGCGGGTPMGGGQADLATAPSDLAVPGRIYMMDKVGGCAQAGYQTQIAVAPDGKTVGIVTLAQTGGMGTCMPLMRPPMQVPSWGVCFEASAMAAEK